MATALDRTAELMTDEDIIEVDLSKLEAGHSIHLSDLTLPAGVTAVVHGDNPTIATATVPAGKVEEASEEKK